jgi:hypothetical protein
MASILHRNNKSIRFDTALNWEDEDRRTAHGVEVRRERKQRKKERKMARDQEERRVREAFAILRETGRLQAINVLWNKMPFRHNLSLFLSEAGVHGDIHTLDQQLDAFQDPNSVFRHRDLNENALDYLGFLTSHAVFAREFFPASIVSSSSEDTTESMHDMVQGLLQDEQAVGNGDEQHAAANAENLANAAAPPDLNQGNDPNEDGAAGNENGDGAAAAAAAPENDVV